MEVGINSIITAEMKIRPLVDRSICEVSRVENKAELDDIFMNTETCNRLFPSGRYVSSDKIIQEYVCNITNVNTAQKMLLF